MGLGVLNDGLALTPPMGWNSWNYFGCNINEELIREITDSIVASGMRDAGYQYVVIDDGWHSSCRDSSGNLQPNPSKFPRGIAALADYIHAAGLKFGIYTDVGTRTCQGFPGSLGYEERDAYQFAEWGVDFLKIDWCYAEGLDQRTQYTRWRDALLKTGRPTVFSICEWGLSRPWEWAGTVGHLWRTTQDIIDNWESVLGILDQQINLFLHAGPGHWNDPDMLEVGNGGMSNIEYRSHFSLWCMLAAPLMAGNDLRNMSEETRQILTAPEVISVNQDLPGRQGKMVRAHNNVEIWVKPLLGMGERAVVLLNRGLDSAQATVYWEEIELKDGLAQVRDLWQRQDLGIFEGCYEATVQPHGVVMVKVKGGDKA